jgi:hypothetical protein
MPKNRKPQRGTYPSRHGLAVALLLLLPLFALAGTLVPGVVSVAAEGEDDSVVESPRKKRRYRPVRMSRQPLLVPRDYSTGFVPELLDLEQLFMGTQSRTDVGERVARLPSFPTSRGDVIVLDDVDTYVGETIFKDVLAATAVADTSDLFDPTLFNRLPSPVGPNTGYEYDDFAGTGDGIPFGTVPIPEPRTAVTLALGLCGLAVWSSHRAQRQPATS